ncbi:hypothetical protein BH10PLA2_BH10PLA2_35750 [soil metagenome]
MLTSPDFSNYASWPLLSVDVKRTHRYFHVKARRHGLNGLQSQNYPSFAYYLNCLTIFYRQR